MTRRKIRALRIEQCNKKLKVRNELRSVMDDTIRTFVIKNAEDGCDRHSDINFVRFTDEVGGDLCPFFEFNDCQNIWFQGSELVTCG